MFWLAILVAVLLPLRVAVKALEAPMALRAALGLVMITALVVLAGLFVARRMRGGVTRGRAAAGVWSIALFLIGFAVLLDKPSPLVAVVVGLTGLAAIGTALAASFWSDPGT